MENLPTHCELRLSTDCPAPCYQPVEYLVEGVFGEAEEGETKLRSYYMCADCAHDSDKFLYAVVYDLKTDKAVIYAGVD